MLYLKKFFRWHLLLWLAYFGYVVLGQYLYGHPTQKGIWLDASFMVARIVIFYFGYLLIFPRLLRAGRLPLLALGVLVAGVVFASVRAVFEEGLYPLLLGFRNYWPGTSFSTYFTDGVYYALPNVAMAGALWASETALRRERENQQLATEKRAAELAFLKTQINPHFLYNTLNMLYGLAYGVDKTLAGGLLKLSELMRYMLRDTPDGLVDLCEEVDYLHNFLDLYRLRYPGRMHAELAVVGDPTGHRVAPLLLVPFVENAFKHGVLDDPTTPVRMQLTLSPGTVEFTVENQSHDYLTDSSSGIGLANLHRRLELLYPGRYTWQVGPAGAQFRARLQLSVPATPTSSTPQTMPTELTALVAVASA
jgi:two-component system LytT family sensor kinase